MPDSKRSSSIWRAKGSRRGEFGLITLEWLLIFGAIAGIAASSVLAVQIVIDDSTDLPDRPDVRVVDAEIAAATVASEATEVMRGKPLIITPTQRTLVSREDCEKVANEYQRSGGSRKWVPADWTPPIGALDRRLHWTIRAKCDLRRLTIV